MNTKRYKSQDFSGHRPGSHIDSEDPRLQLGREEQVICSGLDRSDLGMFIFPSNNLFHLKDLYDSLWH